MTMRTITYRGSHITLDFNTLGPGTLHEILDGVDQVLASGYNRVTLTVHGDEERLDVREDSTNDREYEDDDDDLWNDKFVVITEDTPEPPRGIIHLSLSPPIWDDGPYPKPHLYRTYEDRWAASRMEDLAPWELDVGTSWEDIKNQFHGARAWKVT